MVKLRINAKVSEHGVPDSSISLSHIFPVRHLFFMETV